MAAQSWTLKSAHARSLRKIAAAKAAIEKHIGSVAVEWSDEDSFLETLAERLVNRFKDDLDDLAKDIKSAVDEKLERDVHLENG